MPSCKKESNIGLDVQPTTDLTSSDFKDTVTVQTFIIREDSLRTSNGDFFLAGSMNDAVFGKTSSAIYTQLSLPSNQTNIDLTGGLGLASELKLDSAVLTLHYATTGGTLKYYGSLDAQTFNVYELNQAMSTDSSYYSNDTIQRNTTPIATKTFIPQPDSQVTVSGIKHSPHLRIKLDSTFGANIMNQSGGVNFGSTQAFQNYMKGLYVVPNNPSQVSGQGSILYFATTGSETKLILYYRRRTSSPQLGDTLTFSFEVNTAAARFSRYKHDYSGTTFSSNIGDGIQDSNTIYIQSLGGLKTKVTIPYLKNLGTNANIALNKAEVLLSVDGSTVTTGFDPHQQLFLLPLDANGKYYFPIDYLDQSAGYGGGYNSTIKQYKFNLTQHIQKIIKGEIIDYGFYIVPGGGGINANRTVLTGGGKASGKLKLRLTYTNIN